MSFSSRNRHAILASLVGISSGLFTLGWYKSKYGNISAEDKNKEDNIDYSYVQLVEHTKDEENKPKREKKILNKAKHKLPLDSSCSTVTYNKQFKNVLPKIFKILHQAKEEYGCPGLSFAISRNGELVMKGGIGLADVENLVPCTSETILRIASISKSLTTLAIGKLLEEGKLDLQKTIQEYVPTFPAKTFDGIEAPITLYDLLTHTSGIRGYLDDAETRDPADDKSKRTQRIKLAKYGDSPVKEMHFKDHYKSVQDGLSLFDVDPLMYKPGTDYEYSTFAYGLVSRVIECSGNVDFVDYIRKICYELGMENTTVELNDPLIYNRARNYNRKNGRLVNAPYVDNSYKWAGGGFLSNVEDLVKFGNVMLLSAQTQKGYLQPSTVATLWQPCDVTTGKVSKKWPDLSYALGWCTLPNKNNHGKTILHAGGAVGASSILMLCEEKLKEQNKDQIMQDHDSMTDKPKGSVIAIVVNMEGVGLTDAALKIQKYLEKCVQ